MTPNPGKGTAERYRLSILIASVSLLLVSAGGMFLVTVSMLELQMLFGSRSAPSLAFSLQFVGSGIGGIVMGYILDKRGFGIPAFVGAIMVGFGAMLASMVEAAWQLYVIYLIMFGLAGQGALAAPAMANIAKWYDRRRGMAVGIVAGGQSLAAIVWPPIYSRLLDEIGWRSLFFWYGVFCLIVMLPLCLIVKRRPPTTILTPPTPGAGNAGVRGPARAEPRAPLSPNATTTILSCAITGCCVAMALPLGHLIALVQDLGYTRDDGAYALSILMFSAFTSRCVFVGLLADRFGGLRSLFAFSAIQGTMLAAMTTVSDLWLLYAVGALFGLGYGGIFPVFAVAIREHLPITQVGRRTGLIFMFGAVAMGFGGWLGGFLFDLTGAYNMAFFIGVAFNAANLIIVGLLIARIRPARPQPAMA